MTTDNHPATDPKVKMLEIALDTISADHWRLVRAELRQDAIDDYAEAYRNGAKLPPLVIFEDVDGQRYPGDGFHRLMACRAAGFARAFVALHYGGLRDAVFHALSANREHGLHPSIDDKRAMIRTMRDQFSDWSDREIARKIGCSHGFVGRVKAELEGGVHLDSESRCEQATENIEGGQRPSPPSPLSQREYAPPRTVQRGGQQYPMKVAGVAEANRQRQDDREPPPVPPMGAGMRTLREQAERATIRALDVAQVTAWLDRALDSERREVAMAAFHKIRADADKRALSDQLVAWRVAE